MKIKKEGEITISYKIEDESYTLNVFDAGEDREVAHLGFCTDFIDDGREKDDIARRMFGAISSQIFGMLVGLTEKKSTHKGDSNE